MKRPRHTGGIFDTYQKKSKLITGMPRALRGELRVQYFQTILRFDSIITGNALKEHAEPVKSRIKNLI
jgi:hypothetical protein